MTDIRETIARLRPLLPGLDPGFRVIFDAAEESLTMFSVAEMGEVQTDARNAALEEAAALIEPGPSPCDCITILDDWHVARCDCRNGGDAERAAEWCADMNNAKRIRALRRPA